MLTPFWAGFLGGTFAIAVCVTVAIGAFCALLAYIDSTYGNNE